MDIDYNSVRGGFVPFDITLKIRNQEEAGALYAVFNFAPLDGWFRENNISPEAMRKALQDAGGKIPAYKGPFEDLQVTLREWYDDKTNP